MTQPIVWSGRAAVLEAVASCTGWYKIDGTSSFEQVMTFRLFKAKNPDCLWRYATVDRFDGLTLFRISGGRKITGLRFSELSCGSTEPKSMATVEVLVLAGFGSPARISPKIFEPYQEGEPVRCFPE